MAWEYSRILFEISLVLKQPSKVNFWTAKLIFQFFDPSKMDLNAPNPSKRSTGQPSWRSLNQTSQPDSHPGSHSIKPVSWTAILAVAQSSQSTGQPSWQPLKLNQTSQ